MEVFNRLTDNGNGALTDGERYRMFFLKSKSKASRVDTFTGFSGVP